MISLSYNISTQLRDNLLVIESMKRKILLTPLSPHAKRLLRFEATTARIYYGIDLPKTLSLSDISSLIMLQSSKNATRLKDKDVRVQIMLYKSALDYVAHEWLVTVKKVDTRTVIHFSKLLQLGKLRCSHDSMQMLLDYFETQHESPIIQSGLVLTQIRKLQPFQRYNEHLAQILSLLYLYKGCYDFRGFAAVEEELRKTNSFIDPTYTQAMTHENQTLWLEYYTSQFIKQLNQVFARMNTLRRSEGWDIESPIDTSQEQDTVDMDSLSKLNERQRTILTILDAPTATITNKLVQEAFRISQITASRDLARLTELGFLSSHGNGRSTYYSKI